MLVHWQQFLTEVDPKIRGWSLESQKRQDMLGEHFTPRSSYPKYQVIFTLTEKRFPPPPCHLHTWMGIEQELRGLDLNSSPSWGASSLEHPLARDALGAPGQGWRNCRSRQGEADAEPWCRSSLEAWFVQVISVSDSNQKHFASLCSEVRRRPVLPSELLLLYIHSCC